MLPREQSEQELQHRILLDVKVVMQDENLKATEELIENLDATEFVDELTNHLNLKKLVIAIKQIYNFCFENKEIYYFLVGGDLFVNCGIDPINDDIKIRQEDYIFGLTVKSKNVGVSLVHRLMSFQNVANPTDEKNCVDEIAEKSKCRRTKQRRIGHIIDKVIQWRKYYSGLINEKNQQVKYSLEQAAKEVKISKKSLDDYLFQIRFGHRFGFNFNEHYNDKVGVLRDFVRQRKKTDRMETKTKKSFTKIHEGEEYE